MNRRLLSSHGPTHLEASIWAVGRADSGCHVAPLPSPPHATPAPPDKVQALMGRLRASGFLQMMGLLLHGPGIQRSNHILLKPGLENFEPKSKSKNA